jgi:hypothetical protein
MPPAVKLAMKLTNEFKPLLRDRGAQYIPYRGWALLSMNALSTALESS